MSGRPRAADDADAISARLKELRREHDQVLAGEVVEPCGCVRRHEGGAWGGVHLPGCPVRLQQVIEHYAGLAAALAPLGLRIERPVVKRAGINHAGIKHAGIKHAGANDDGGG